MSETKFLGLANTRIHGNFGVSMAYYS